MLIPWWLNFVKGVVIQRFFLWTSLVNSAVVALRVNKMYVLCHKCMVILAELPRRMASTAWFTYSWQCSKFGVHVDSFVRAKLLYRIKLYADAVHRCGLCRTFPGVAPLKQLNVEGQLESRSVFFFIIDTYDGWGAKSTPLILTMALVTRASCCGVLVMGSRTP